MILNLSARVIIILSLASENANSQCKRIIRHLKARSVLIEKWIQNTVSIDSFNHDNAWLDRRSDFQRLEEKSKCPVF